MGKVEKAIHSVLKQVNWEFVMLSTKQLNLNKDKKYSKTELVEELTGILKNVLETNKKHLVTDLWTINHEKLEGHDEFILEVIFTPMIAWVDTFNSNTKKDKLSRLQQRLKLALEIEDFEQAIKIDKSLQKLRTKSK
jgi:hypothetical protein